MITNPEILKDTFKCNAVIKEYLVYHCHLPILGYDEKYFYFSNTDELKECLKHIPLTIKLLSIFKKGGGNH
jgi:hypothetical protein